MNQDETYMRLALAEAQKAFDLGEVPIGAILVDRNGGIIFSGHNMRESWHDATAHAEMIVIQEACKQLKRWRLTGTTLYVTIEPCPMCAGALVMSRIDRIVYGGLDYKAGAAESVFNIVDNAALNHQLQVTAGVLSDECSAIMKTFFRQRRKTNKQEKKAR
ncbi:tRNA adenosine(34) deaminase TadA [Propionispira raffinosivorans]|uniref:tRNA adenosine(34) deaminase TadA n=1 Tax=Propionispira raffinosivorans TaxID=86959 RepID=UPI000374B776|nr:tRNA adenosine(34) deaminase TadA [Propionispira raffinosivorans]